MSPSRGLYAPRGGTIYKYIKQVQVHASMNPSTTSSVASLVNIGRWAVAPCEKLKFYIYTDGTHTHTHTDTDTDIHTHTPKLTYRNLKINQK